MILKSQQLATYIRNEVKNLEQLVTLAQQRVASAKTRPEEANAYIESAALHLQSFYTAVEQILSRIAENIDESIPDGSAWHIDLLRQMTYEAPGRRPSILRSETHDALDELRGFRHRVRNLYTFHLNPDRVVTLTNSLPHTLNLFADDLENLIGFLDSSLSFT